MPDQSREQAVQPKEQLHEKFFKSQTKSYGAKSYGFFPELQRMLGFKPKLKDPSQTK